MIGPAECPYCGRVNTKHDAVDDKPAPDPGDISICDRCGGATIFTDDGVRLPSIGELDEIEAHPTVQALRRAMADQ